LKNKQNKGPFYSRNKAAVFAKGEYIQFMDSDDILINNILEKAYIIAKKNNIDIIQYKFVKRKHKFYIEAKNIILSGLCNDCKNFIKL
jgi:glycosyltransferase involved in cell wall biosynthesis